MKSPVTFFTNGVDKSLGATSAWTDIDVTTETASDADGAILFIKNTGAVIRKGDVRKNEGTDNHSANASVNPTGCRGVAIGMDASQIFEGWIDHVAVDFYLIGYCKPAVGIIQVTDSIGLSDAVLTNKTLLITDAIGLADVQYAHKMLLISDAISLADQVLRNKTFTITDSISLSEVIQVITEIIKEVTDAISLSDQVLVNKTLTVTDQIRAVDAPLVNKVLLLQDAISLLDQILRNKAITITDQIQLADLVETIVAGLWLGLFGEVEILQSKGEMSILSPLGTLEVKHPKGEMEIVKR